jgi:hypothetical protein
MRLTTTVCFPIITRSNNSAVHLLSTLLQHLRQFSPRFFQLSVYISTKPPSIRPSVLPALCLHFYKISVISALGFPGSLSTLLQHLPFVSHRFSHLSALYITAPSNQPSPVLRPHVNFSAAGLQPTAYFIITCQSEPVQFWAWAGTFVCNNVLAWVRSLGSSKIPCYLYGHYDINRIIIFEH